jgi:hypothetical protein
MKRKVLGMLFAGLLVGGLIACRQVMQSPVDRVGALLWEMTEIHTAARDALLASRGTDAEKQAIAASAAKDLADRRNRLAELAPSLDPATALAVRLARFVDAWPTEQAFREDLLDTSARGSRAGAEITGLAWLAPDTRSHWKTPFKIRQP